jgi:regulator of RNase E activity RraA
MPAAVHEPLSPQTIAHLKQAATSTLTTQLFKRGLRNAFIQGVRALSPPQENMVGPAFTLRNIPAREDIDQVSVFENPEHPQRKAIETCPAGHVLVIDCRGDTRAASGGHILMTRLMVRRCAGVVSDGGMRDAAGIAELALPVFCSGPSAPLNLAVHHAAEMNVAIGCGGVAVYPGDVMVGDGDGVVVIPRHLADEVARDAAEQEQLEVFVQQQVAKGAKLPGTYPPNAATKAAFETWRSKRGTV